MLIDDFLKKYSSAAVALSGGADSSYLLCKASQCIDRVEAFFVKSDFQFQNDFADAKRLCKSLNVKLNVINIDTFSYESIIENTPLRCYHCKKVIFNNIICTAKSRGLEAVFDGTNFDDDPNDRPGFAALKELGIISPLRECKLTKKEIRVFAKEEGIEIWDKPSQSCLATRIREGERITKELLDKISFAESEFAKLGFTDFRIKDMGDTALIRINSTDFSKFSERRENILNSLGKYYSDVHLDLKARETND